MLYKYRSLSGPYGRQNVVDIILSNSMRWQSPAAFNDPFDCVPQFDTNISDAAFKEWMKDAHKRSTLVIPRGQRRAAITRKTNSKPAFIKNLEASFVETLSHSPVTCFSLVKNQPLMWAHYADAHAGVMIEFEEPKSDINFCGLRVKYVDTRPLVDPTAFLAGDAEIRKAILTKSSDWAYEEEVRMVEYRVNPGPRHFDPIYLKSITFGLKTSDDDRKFITDAIATRNVPLPVFQATLDSKAYKISNILTK